MGRIMKMIEEQIPGIYILSLEIGNTFVEDTLNGFLMPISQQVFEFSNWLQLDLYSTRDPIGPKIVFILSSYIISNEMLYSIKHL